MNNQPRLIDADKLLEWLEREEIKNYWMKDAEGAAKARVLSALSREVIEGTFDPDPIPLPTIKPGDSVWHERFKAKGIVERISKSGKKAYVRWERGMPSYVDLKSLEVSHD